MAVSSPSFELLLMFWLLRLILLLHAAEVGVLLPPALLLLMLWPAYSHHSPPNCIIFASIQLRTPVIAVLFYLDVLQSIKPKLASHAVSWFDFKSQFATEAHQIL